MRIPSHSRQRGSLDNDSMTPMIDVVFLLLVFFVCASIGQKPDRLLPAELAAGTTESKVEIPPEDPDAIPSQEVRIQLKRDSLSGELTIALNEGPLSGARELKQRLERLATLDPDTKIIMDVADEVTVQQFIAVYDLCQALAFNSISFAVR